MAKLFPLKNVSKTFLSKSIVQTSLRSISTSDSKFQLAESKVIEPKEVRVEVPWGHVAGKWYGSENIRPVVMLHGWQDNAGTFNTLIPLLPKHLSYLSIDLPGHGLSSRLPHGMFYSVMNFINTLTIIQQHYKWDQLSFCSHSMGAQISGLFASLYPDRCDFLICLDSILKPHQAPMDKKIEHIQRIGRDFISLDKLNRLDKEPPTYTLDEVIERWAKQSKLKREAVEHLAQRGVCQSKLDPNRFYFSRDIRLKIMEFGSITLPDYIQYKLMEQLTAPYLFIRASKTQEFEGMERYEKAFEILQASNPKFQWTSVVGGHHVHLTEPTVISGILSDFINKYRP